jgi:predicted dehydrogenase
MLRIVIVGCGKIADQHVQAIARLTDCSLVAVCDREVLMARQLAERFKIAEAFSDVGEMLARIRPDVVHITTPPQSHFPLARQCLEAGCHVYLEKPFTVTANETETLIELAEKSNLKLTAGHNLQFTLEMLEMRRLAADGFLGGKPVHLESHFPYSLEDATYVGPVLGSKNHWVRKLPGKLLHNILSHPVAKLAEFLDDELDEIIATAHQSPRLRELGGQEVLDELRVMIRDQSGTTAYLCFSTQLRPGLNQLRIFGPKNAILVDHGSGCVVRHPNRSSKSYLTFFLPPLRLAREHFRCGIRNIKNFISRRLHQDAGMKELMGRFYNSIREGGAPPLPYREILLTARIMDQIFAQIYRADRTVQTEAALQPLS